MVRVDVFRERKKKDQKKKRSMSLFSALDPLLRCTSSGLGHFGEAYREWIVRNNVLI